MVKGEQRASYLPQQQLQVTAHPSVEYLSCAAGMVQERKFVANHRDLPRAVLPAFAQTDLDIRPALLGEGDHPAPPVTACDHSGSSQMG